jgi:transglutaminase-like putative cysteine protease
MPVLTVRHVTTYKYRRPVGFGEHRGMFRPRDSEDQKVLEFSLVISPTPSLVRHVQDPFGNVITLASFNRRARELSFVSTLKVRHTPLMPGEADLLPWARAWPFSYDPDTAADLQRSIERQYPDQGHAVEAWARTYVERYHNRSILALLSGINDDIRRDFTYTSRHEEGIQEPARTLALRSGTCRDFAVLMMETARTFGLAARFVSGYIYSPGADRTPADRTPAKPPRRLGGGSTHAWIEVFLPGAGWVEFDPTNGIVGTRDLIRIACVRDPHQAVPLSGSWTGFPADSEGMEVSVDVTSDEATHRVTRSDSGTAPAMGASSTAVTASDPGREFRVA